MTASALIRPGLVAAFLLSFWVIWSTNLLSLPSTLDKEQGQIATVLAQILQKAGAVIVPAQAKPGTVLEKTVTFRMPDCADPLVVVPLRLGLSEEAILQALVENSGRDYKSQTIYRGEAMKGYGFVAFQLQSLIIEARQVFGVNDVRFARQALMLMTPARCAKTSLPNWGAFWQLSAA